MSNIDKAVQVIYDEVNQAWERGEILTTAGEAERLASALADAGLLAPELPDESWPQVWEVEGFLVAAIEDGGETIELAENEGDGNVGYGWFMDRRLARNLAYALLAAANYQEKA